MNPETLRAFRKEIEKTAAIPQTLVRAGRFLSDSPMRGALIGAGTGAVAGAVAAGGDDGIGGRVRGAISGAAVGGAVGGGAAGLGRSYRDAKLLNPTGNGAVDVAKQMGQSVANFGKRTVHGLTGHLDPNQIGMRGSALASKQEHLEGLRLTDRLKGAKTPGAANKLREASAAEVKSIKEQGAQGDTARRLGITNLPGIAKALGDKSTRGAALRGMKHELAGGSMLSVGGALGVGVPAAMGAVDIAKGDESATGGRTIKQKVVNTGVNLGSGLLTAGMPMGAQMIAGTAADLVGNRAAKGWRPGRRSAAPVLEAGGQP